MFSLKQKKKQPAQQQEGNKKQQKSVSPSKISSNPNISPTANKQKNQSKKVSKTIFDDPFYYHIQLLPQQQTAQVMKVLTEYITKLRQKMPYKAARQGLIKTIKFEKDKQIKQKQSPLTCNKLIIGIKQSKSVIYRHHCQNKNKLKDQQKMLEQQNQKIAKIPQLVLIFYDQQKHEHLLQLFCLIKIINFPYLILKQSPEINRILGVRTVGALCLMEESFANTLLAFIGRCGLDIPWVTNIEAVVAKSVQKQQ